MTGASLFSGILGIEMGLEDAGAVDSWLWYADSDGPARAVIANEHSGVRCYHDVREIDEQAPPPDIICGGFPCQDISLAGRGAGIDGERSGLWSEFARIVRVLRPRIVFVENVAALTLRGLDRVLRDLAALGFDAEWSVLRASDVGAPHIRARIFILAYSDGDAIRELAERYQRSRRGARAAERGDAEPVDDRGEMADAPRAGRADVSGVAGQGRALVGAGAGADGGTEPGNSAEGVSARGRATGGGSEVPALADPARERRTEGRAESARQRRNADVPGDGDSDDVANADGSGQRSSERDLRTGESDAAGRGEDMADPDRLGLQERDGGPSGTRGGSDAEQDGGGRDALDMADADGGGCSILGRPERDLREGGVDDADGRSGARRRHVFPPGPAGLAGWDGPQPAIRRGDDGVPGRAHRLRLLGNAAVPQQVSEAFGGLVLRAAAAVERAA